MNLLFTLLWIGFALYFVIVEGISLYLEKKKHGNGWTLSEHLRNWFMVNKAYGRTTFIVLFGVFAALFIVHIAAPSESPW